MIIDFNVNFKSYNEKILNNYNFFNYKCPKCGAIHSLIRHSSYDRNIIFIKDSNIYEQQITILRLKCNSCNSTHAILPNDVIPYYIYSYSYIFQVLIEHFINGDSVLSISSKYNISFQLIYIFISRFNHFLIKSINTLRILGLLKDIVNPSHKDVLESIIKHGLVDSFLELYFKTNNWMFLMTKFQNIISCPIYIGFKNSHFNPPT